MSKTQAVKLTLTIDEAIMQPSADVGSRARLKPTVCVHNEGESLVNVGASNFKFCLLDENGKTLEDLGIALGDEFHLTKENDSESFSCLLRATDKGIQPGVKYKLCLEAFDQKCDAEFEFAAE